MLLAIFLFNVPLKGSFAILAIGARVYVVDRAYGLVISAFTRTQIAALFATAILAMVPAMIFSGILIPVSSLAGWAP